MKVYAKLVRQKEQALSLFTETRAKLVNLYDALVTEHNACSSVIKDEVEKQKFLEQEMAHVANTKTNIDRVIGDEG